MENQHLSMPMDGFTKTYFKRRLEISRVPWHLPYFTFCFFGLLEASLIKERSISRSEFAEELSYHDNGGIQLDYFHLNAVQEF